MTSSHLRRLVVAVLVAVAGPSLALVSAPAAGAATALRHAEYFAGWLETLARDAGQDARALTGALALEFANAERAWETAVRPERADWLAAMRPALVRYTELQGRWRDACVMLGAALYIASNVLIDIAYTWVDPRVRLS